MQDFRVNKPIDQGQKPEALVGKLCQQTGLLKLPPEELQNQELTLCPLQIQLQDLEIIGLENKEAKDLVQFQGLLVWISSVAKTQM